MASTKRDHLIDTALELFNRHGFHATGIDRILAESGVAKMTLYNHFKSKDELIRAVLRRRDETFRNNFMRAVERGAETPRERLLVMFDVLEGWFRDNSFSGCLFINATAEFCRDTDTIQGGCVEHKKLVLDYVRGLTAAAGARNSDALARALNLLMEGATVTAQVLGAPEVARDARRAAEVLVRDALGPAD